MRNKSDKKIIVQSNRDKQIHVCDSSGELKYSFPTKEPNEHHLSISNENEIIAAGMHSKFVYIYTEERNLKRKFEVAEDHKIWGIAFNHVTEEVIVHKRYDGTEYISSYSTTCRKLETVARAFEWEAGCFHLTSHPSGPVALVSKKSILYIQ